VWYTIVIHAGTPAKNRKSNIFAVFTATGDTAQLVFKPSYWMEVRDRRGFPQKSLKNPFSKNGDGYTIAKEDIFE